MEVLHTAKERPVRIQYNCLVPIYVFPEMKLCVQPPYFQNRVIMFCIPIPPFIHISVRDLYSYISRIGLSILLQPNMLTDPENICIHRSQTHECGNWD